MPTSRFQMQLTLTWAVLMTVTIVACIVAADGNLIYALDDPYIHLAIAENLPRGQWGVNLEEPASASSSVLYPLLLALTQMVGLASVGPLVVVLPATAATVWIFARLVAEWCPPGAVRWGLGIAGLVLLCAFALPMVGMEHSLHVLVTVMAFDALVRFARDGSGGRGLTASVILLPLLRFEGLAMAGLLMLVQVARGRFAAVAVQAAVLAVLLGAYVALMLRLGLPILPSSVLMKSGATASAVDGGWMVALDRLRDGTSLLGDSISSTSIRALLLANIFAFLAFPRQRGDAFVLMVVTGTLAAHIVAGGESFYPRREVYALVLGALGLVHFARPLLTSDSSARRCMLPIFLLMASVTNLQVTIIGPLASRNIYQQQYQMHRFVTEVYRAPVAVNDLGWVAYKNDNYVLDLLGLGSERVRKLSAIGPLDAAALRTLLGERDVRLAIVYDRVFPDRPDDWILVARLTTSRVSVYEPTVSFFAVGEDEAARLRPMLAAFQPSLPPGAIMTLH